MQISKFARDYHAKMFPEFKEIMQGSDPELIERYENFAYWKREGLVPFSEIESGYNTGQLIRERGWKYWHQLFNPRQLFLLSRFAMIISVFDRTLSPRSV